MTKYYGLQDEEITKPLLAWMFSRVYQQIQHYDLDKLPNTTIKSLIYFQFIHSLIQGREMDPNVKEDKKKIEQLYLKEKRILRMVATLKQIHRTDLTIDDLKQKQNIFGFGQDELPRDLKDILAPYIYLRDEGDNIKIIDFIHETFKEYFLAENYFEGLLKGNTNWVNLYLMNIGNPSPETMDFLDGLIRLLLYETYNESQTFQHVFS